MQTVQALFFWMLNDCRKRFYSFAQFNPYRILRMVRKTEPKNRSFLTKTERRKLNRNWPTSRWAKPLQHNTLVYSVTSISESRPIFSIVSFPLPWDRHLSVNQVNNSPNCTLPCNAWSTSISVLIRNPVQCLFCFSGVFHALQMTNTTVILSLLWFQTHLVLLFSLLLHVKSHSVFFLDKTQ